MRDRSRLVQQGFTLIELMIVVAIIAILAAIVIPTWTREANRAKGKSEVTAMFTELAAKEEQYKVENNVFLDVPTCPAAPVPAGYNFTTTCITAGSNLMLLRVAAPESTMRCTYYVKTGLSSDVLTPPGTFKNSQGTAAAEGALAVSWWWLLATCDEDGQGGTNATYYKSSVDSTLQVQDEGS